MKSIVENNILIAEFMGGKLKNGTYSIEGKERREMDVSAIYWNDDHTPEQLEYDVSYDWLMPVVEEIEGLGYAVEIIETYCLISKRNDLSIADNGGGDFTKLSAVYKSVVEFIKWYNTNTDKS